MLPGRRTSWGEGLEMREKEDGKISAGCRGIQDCGGVVRDEIEKESGTTSGREIGSYRVHAGLSTQPSLFPFH